MKFSFTFSFAFHVVEKKYYRDRDFGLREFFFSGMVFMFNYDYDI